MAKLEEEERERQREIGERITDRRKELRLTQPVVADQAGVSLRAYQNWEAGDTRIAWPNLEKLADILHMPVDDILYGSPEEREATTLPTNLQELMDAFETRLTAIEDGQAQILEMLRMLSKSPEAARAELEAELERGPGPRSGRERGSDAATRRRKR